MIDPNYKLPLNIPHRTRTTLSLCKANCESINEWVQSLPKANLIQFARLLYQTTQELNELSIPIQGRFELLEVLQPNFNYVCKGLEASFLNQPFLLSSKAATIFELTITLQSFLVTGYKIVASEGLKHLNNTQVRITTAAAMQRALEGLTEILKYFYQLHCAPSKQLWHEIHEIYKISEQNHLTQLATHCKSAPDTASYINIEDVYKCILLFASCNPHQIVQQQITTIYSHIKFFTSKTTISPQSSAKVNLFVDIDQDNAPTHILTETDKPNGTNIRFLDCQKLIQNLTEQLVNNSTPANLSGSEDNATALPVFLIRHLIHAWGAKQRRSFTRTTTDNRPLKTIIGLSAIHYHLSGKKKFNDMLLESNIDSDEQNSSFLPDNFSDLWGHSFDASPLQDQELKDVKWDTLNHSPDELDNKLKQQSLAYSERPSDILNISQTGLCLAFSKGMPDQLKTGELIGIQEPGSDLWEIGLIRWITQQDVAKTLIGIELLAAYAFPAITQIFHADNNTKTYNRALVFHDSQNDPQMTFLIVPTLGYKMGANVTLYQEKEKKRVQLTRMVHKTNCISEFEVNFITEEKVKKNNNDGSNEPFDWSTLKVI